MLQQLSASTQKAMAFSSTDGLLNLAVLPTLSTRWLIPRLGGFMALHPDAMVNFSARTEPFDFVGTPFDAAIQFGTPHWAGAVCEFLMHEDVVPVCSPRLLQGPTALTPAQIAGMPLLQQSTRPYGWRKWFDAQQADAPLAMDGPRYELFSMLAVAASHGLGVALMPVMLIEAELARGELVVACHRPLHGERGYYLVTPVQDEDAPVVVVFSACLKNVAQNSAAVWKRIPLQQAIIY